MKVAFTSSLFAIAIAATAQSNYAPLNVDYYSIIDRYEIKAGQVIPYLFTSVKPYKRSDIVLFLDSARDLGVFTSRADDFNWGYLNNDSWEWSRSPNNESKKPVLRHFYKKKSDFYYVDNDDLDLHINPVIYLGAGGDSRRDDPLFVNTRGVEVRGMVDRKVGFYTYLTDNQALLPSYVADQMGLTNAVPHEGFWKAYKEGEGVDFLQARGYITFEATRHINIQLGHDRFFIGNGHRSLIFSDFGPPSFFFKGNVRVWRLNYLFLVNQMIADNRSLVGSRSYPIKYNAFHHLSLNVARKLNVGVFESVIFSPDDPSVANGFRLDYLNPIIFYRAIEQQNGSSDNVLLGLDFKWNAVKCLSFYGQFLLDEFVINNIRAGNGWWANKFGIQAGAHYVDAFGVSNLDLQGEINIVRPYTYAHSTLYGSYSNYRQPIAHPLGANFREAVGILRYQPLGRLRVTARLSVANIGRDAGVENWGSNILKLTTTHPREFNNTIGQGTPNDIVSGSVTASFQFRHNLFIDGYFQMRNSNSPGSAYDNNTSITSVALRWNVAQRLYDF